MKKLVYFFFLFCCLASLSYAQEQGEYRVTLYGSLFNRYNIHTPSCKDSVWAWLVTANKEYEIGKFAVNFLGKDRQPYEIEGYVPNNVIITGIKFRSTQSPIVIPKCFKQSKTEITPLNNLFSYSSCFSRSISNAIPYWGSNDSSIDIVPKGLKIYNQGSNNLSYKKNIEITSTKGFKENQYYWRYSFDGVRWYFFANEFTHHSTLSGTGEELLGEEFFNHVGKNIHIRGEYHCYEKHISNILTYKLMLDAPSRIGYSQIAPKCVGERNGAVKIRFDRALMPNETINLAIAERGKDLVLNNVVNIDKFDADNSYTLEIGKHGFSGLGAGSYTIRTLGKIGNNATVPPPPFNISIQDPAPVSYTLNYRDIRCFEANDGQIQITATGGTGSYSVSINGANYIPFNQGIRHILINQAAGPYSIRIQDSNGCIPKLEHGQEDQRQITLNQPSKALAIEYQTVRDPLAYGYQDGYIQAVIVGGTKNPSGGYSYRWQDNQGNQLHNHSAEVMNSGDGYRISLQNIPAGQYILEVWDNNTSQPNNQANCYLAQNYTINQPEPLLAKIELTKALDCYAAKDGILQATASGGVTSSSQGYQYQWEQQRDGTFQPLAGANNPSLQDLSAGNYRIQITDNNGIQVTSAVYTLTEPTALIPLVQPTNSSCYQADDASIHLSMSGGTGPYEIGLWIPETLAYQWQTFNQGTSHNYTGLAPGLNRIKLRDSKGCTPQDASGAEIEYNIQISQPDQLGIVKENLLHPSAFGYSNGELQVWIAGGNSSEANSYTYSWKDVSGNTLNTHSAQQNDGYYHITLSDLPAGIYSLSLQDAKGCTLTQDYQLDQPEAIELAINLIQQVSCFNGNNGKLEAVASGGITIPGIGYYYQWFRLEGHNNIPIDRTQAIADGLPAGVYSVRITDANNISLHSNTITITQPTALRTTLEGYTPINCFGAADGTISLSASGATAPYQIGIRGPGETSLRWEPFQEANRHLFTGLAPGPYEIQIRDAHACQELNNGQAQIYQLLLEEPAAPLAITAPVLTEPLAYGQENGSIAVLIKGGTPNPDGKYQYEWKDAYGQILQTHNGIVTTEGYRIRLATIPAGTYSLLVTDFAGQSCTITRAFELTQPDPLLVSLNQIRQLACHGDHNASIQATVTGGVRPSTGYKYQWYKINNSQPIRLDEQGPNLLNLDVGSYYLEVIDANAIQVTSNLLTITQPDALIAELSKTDIHCYAGLDGTITSKLTGGTAPYEIGIRLPGAGTYDWKAFSAGDRHIETGLYSGTYELRFRDANGCTVVDEQGLEKTFNLVLAQPDAALTLVSSLMTQPLGYGLSNGKIEVVISGGTAFEDGSYQYSWIDSHGNTLSSHQGQSVQGQYHIRLEHIPAGSYNLRVTDKNNILADIYNNTGCYIQQQFQLEEPAPIVIKLTQSAFISCFGTAEAQLDAEVEGGVLNGTQQDYIYSWYQISDGQREALAIYTTTLAKAKAGDYQLQVQDANGIIQNSEVFRIQQPDLLQVQATDIDIACGDSQNGRIVSNVTGGTAPYRYEWSNGASSPDLENAGVGKYLLIVTDANGCSASTQALVSSPSGLELEFTLTQPSCHGATDGSISLNTKGGALPLRFEWEDGRQEKDLSALKAGSYKLRISDANGCTIHQEFTLTDPPQLVADAGPDISICRDQHYAITAKSSEPNVHYRWVGPDNFLREQASIEVWKPGTYTLTLTNSGGCVATDQFTLKTVDIPIDAEFVTATQVFAGLSSTLVNISETEADRIEWIIPTDKADIKILSESNRRIELQFTSPGTYNIGMHAYIGDCSKFFSKQVTVLPSSEMGNIEEEKRLFIDNFVAYPNPSTGQFTAMVSLAEVSDIRLRLVNLSTGRILNDQRHSGQQQYKLPYQLPLPIDLYVLILEVKNEYRTFKIIVK